MLKQLRRLFDEIAAASRLTAETDRERQSVARGEGSDSLRLRRRWFDVWADPDPHLLASVRPYTWVIFPPQVRHISASHHHVPWHQDAGYIRLLGPRRHRKVLSCFVPLDDDPDNRSTLQFCRSVQSELAHIPRAGFAAGLDMRPSDVVHFDLSLGDCLLFGDLVVHRTFTPEGALTDRRSLEFRLIDPRDAIPDKDYFDIERQAFTRADGSVPTNLPR
jgi:hypothetical protein